MTKTRAIMCCTAKTLGKTALLVSHWFLLQSFIQATMWHNTEPRTLGVSYWATGLLVGALCLPGLIYLLKSLVFSTEKSKSNFQHKVLPYLHWFVRVFPGTALMVSALPQLDEDAASRTWVLSVGIVFVNLYIILITWNFETYVLENRVKSDHASKKKQSCATICFVKKEFFYQMWTSTNVGIDATIAVCVSMGVRWSCGTINVFYESWQASLTLTLLIYIYASLVLVFEHSREKQDSSSMAFPRLKSTESNGVQDDKAETPIKINQSAETVSLSTEIYATETPKQYDELKNTKKLDAIDITENHQLNSHIKDEAIVSSVSGDNGRARQDCVSSSYCYAFIYAFVIGPALGALASVCIWIFTSPDVLCLWGEVPVNVMGYLIMVCFVVGCLVANFIDVERLYNGEEFESCADTKHNLKIKRVATCQKITCGMICCFVIAGTCLILYTKNALFLFGSSLLCLFFPSLLRMTLFMSYDFVMICKSLRTPGKRSSINAIPGLILFLCGFTIASFHFLGIFFVNPLLTNIVHGRIDLILLPEICLSLLPLIFGSLLKSKIHIADRIRSSSTGPLLESDAMTSTCNISDESFSKSPIIRIKNCGDVSARQQKYKKTIHAICIIIFLTVVTVVKYTSVQSISNCNHITGCVSEESRTGYDLRVLSWNILLGHRMNGRINLQDIAYYSDLYNPHVLALQEATALPVYWGGKDIFGYLQGSTKSCFERGKVMNPRQGSLEVGMLSRLEILDKSATILTNEGVTKLPSYTTAKISCKLPRVCDSIDEIGSGSDKNQHNSTLHIYTIHAVYKNWTCERYSKISCEQMKYVLDDIRKLPKDDPVIVMGDFNINPSESELDIWYQGNLGFKSAIWPSMSNNSTPTISEINCKGFPIPSDDECDCECRNQSSDPPNSTLLNRDGAVDHIFYRGLRLVGKAKILTEVGEVSDHYPVLADFAFD